MEKYPWIGHINSGAHHCLMSEGVSTIDELCSLKLIDLLRMPNMGRKSINNIEIWLLSKGACLSGKIVREVKDGYTSSLSLDIARLSTQVLNKRKLLTVVLNSPNGEGEVE